MTPIAWINDDRHRDAPTLLQQFSLELEDLLARAAPAAVGIGHARGQGAGLVLASDGYLLTNHHVVGAQRQVQAQLADGRELEGRIIGGDPATDLAVVKVEASGLVSLPLADTRRLRVGQLVLAIGNPYRYERSVSIGVVSALDRALATPAGGLLEGVIQTDAAVNPGNSGGPLINAWGEVVGINTAIIPFAQGIGFAIPAHTVGWVAALLIQRGAIQRRYLGIAARGEQLPPGLVRQLRRRRGVRVLAVEESSPARGAGLREGDLLIGVEGRPALDVHDLQRLLVMIEQEEVALQVWRDGRHHEVRVRPVMRRAA